MKARSFTIKRGIELKRLEIKEPFNNILNKK